MIITSLSDQVFGSLTSVVYVTISIFLLPIFWLMAAGLLLMGFRWYEMDPGRVEQTVWAAGPGGLPDA